MSHTIFTDREIKHGSLFGVRIVREYANVEKLFLDINYLIIHFMDGKKMKIWRAQGDLGKIVSIIQKHAGRAVRVETIG